MGAHEEGPRAKQGADAVSTISTRDATKHFTVASQSTSQWSDWMGSLKSAGEGAMRDTRSTQVPDSVLSRLTFEEPGALGDSVADELLEEAGQATGRAARGQRLPLGLPEEEEDDDIVDCRAAFPPVALDAPDFFRVEHGEAGDAAHSASRGEDSPSFAQFVRQLDVVCAPAETSRVGARSISPNFLARSGGVSPADAASAQAFTIGDRVQAARSVAVQGVAARDLEPQRPAAGGPPRFRSGNRRPVLGGPPAGMGGAGEGVEQLADTTAAPPAAGGAAAPVPASGSPTMAGAPGRSLRRWRNSGRAD